MKPSKLPALFLLLVAFNTGCGHSDGGESKNTKQSNTSGLSPCAQEPCQFVLRDSRLPIKSGNSGSSKLTLGPEETNSLTQAMQTAAAARTGNNTHIHADVANGKLVFSGETPQNSAHVSGDEPEISLGNGKSATPSAVKMVATPAAAKLLQERSRQP